MEDAITKKVLERLGAAMRLARSFPTVTGRDLHYAKAAAFAEVLEDLTGKSSDHWLRYAELQDRADNE